MRWSVRPSFTIMTRHLPVILFLLNACSLYGQRQWELNDSTSYAVGGDTVLIASRHVLYRALPGGTTILRDFSVAEEPDLYIRDVDHWTSRDWYVLVGSRYIGSPTILWRTTDAGESWQVDESFLPATEVASVNQMEITPDGVAYLFNRYYDSEVLRSFDHGVSWTRWFRSLIAHYYGIIPCQGSAFIYGMVGDAFRPAMWQVPDSLWEDEDVQFWSGCHNVIPGCYYPPFGTLDYAGVVAYFEPLAAELCITLAVPDHIGRMGLLPTSFDAATSTLTVPGLDPRVQMEVIDASGRIIPVLRLGERVLLSGTAPGAYAVRIWSGEGMRHARFLKP